MARRVGKEALLWKAHVGPVAAVGSGRPRPESCFLPLDPGQFCCTLVPSRVTPWGCRKTT